MAINNVKQVVDQEDNHMRPSRRNRNKDHDREVPNIPVNWRRLFGYLAPYKTTLAIALALGGLQCGCLFFPLVSETSRRGAAYRHRGQAPDFHNSSMLVPGRVVFYQAAFSFIQAIT